MSTQRKSKLNPKAGFIDLYYLIWVDYLSIYIEEFPIDKRVKMPDGTIYLKEDGATAKRKLERRIVKILQKEKENLSDETRILYVIKGREVFYEATKMVKAVKLTNKLPENITRPNQLTEHVKSGIVVKDG